MRWSRLRIRLFPLLALVVIVAACQGPPPTQYVIITDTPAGELPTVMPSQTPVVIVVTATPETTAVSSPVAPSATPTTNSLPTPTFIQIQVAEQPFEHGRMFWLEPIDQIWVMIEDENDKRSGVWMLFDDEFEEGDVEFDPLLVVPEGLLQPERGFGKLWRENEDIREALGWAKQQEIGHVSIYEYQPAGEMVDGVYEMAPGYHILTSGFGNRSYRFNEINGTWQTIRNADNN